jgi:hypothetical protein
MHVESNQASAAKLFLQETTQIKNKNISFSNIQENSNISRNIFNMKSLFVMQRSKYLYRGKKNELLTERKVSS